MKHAGYKAGLTYQPIPYDWRYSFTSNRLPELFKGIIDDLYSITGKKITIIGHSMGNMNIYYNLLNMDQKSKDTKISRWINIAGPLLGSTDALQAPLSLKPELEGVSKYVATINLKALYDVITNMPSVYDLFPKNTWNAIKKASWFPELFKRITSEQKGTSYQSNHPVIGLFPPLKEMCIGKVVNDRS